MGSMYAIHICVIGTMLLLKQAQSSGHLSILLVRYDNDDGEGSNGNCCDGFGSLCRTECDHYFKVCVDRGNGDDSINSCSVGSEQTGVIQNRDSFDFGRDIGGTPNPLEFPFQRWYTQGVKLKISVWDQDSSNAHDHVDDLVTLIRGNPDQSQATATGRLQIMVSRTRLSLRITSYCDPDWYGEECTTLCVPQDDAILGHYDCDADTGDKLCHDGWFGDSCEIEINECRSAPCVHGGRCRDQLSSYSCICDWPYTGVNCQQNTDPCLNTPCHHGGTCSSTPDTVSCACAPGYTGSYCDVDINECRSAPCRNGGQCVDLIGAYSCSCVGGFTGTNCQVSPCASGPCANGGQCRTSASGFVCDCAAGYNGHRCNINIDECASNPCQHGSVCTDDIAGYQCVCAEGFSGVHCQIVNDPCLGIACLNNAPCIPGNDTDFECQCESGFKGLFCEYDIDECLSGPCEGINSTCVNIPGSFYCACPPYLTGYLCEFENVCETTSPCQNNGKCLSSNDTYSCECEQPWTGNDCEVCSCIYGDCKHGNDSVAKLCTCDEGWSGLYCDVREPCNETYCNMKGECFDDGTQYHCNCSQGFTGARCEIKIDYCGSAPCMNGGNCTPSGGAYTCECLSGFTGYRCESTYDVTGGEHHPSSFMFVGELTTADTETLTFHLLELVATSRDVDISRLDIDHVTNVCQGADGQAVAVLEFQLYDEHGVIVPHRVIDELVNEHLDVLPLPLYNGSECSAPDNKQGKTGASMSEQAGFWEKWQFVVLGVIGTILIVGSVATVIVIKSRRVKEEWSPEVVIGVNNPLFDGNASLITSNDDVSATSPHMPLPPIPTEGI